MKIIIVFIIVIICFFFVGGAPKQNITWGINFSQKYAQSLDLNWQETYLSLIGLGVKDIKLLSHWDLIEPVSGKYFFDDLDWQIQKAEENNANIILTVGMKTGRWPECHIPDWAQGLTKEEQQEKILRLVAEIILRYRDSKAIEMWQVENEPLFPFGHCPWADEDFLKKEIELVRFLDQRKILMTDSGEGSFWVVAARNGDMVGTTMYQKVWIEQIERYLDYFFPPVFYYRKSLLIKWLYGKPVICSEFQAEPWGPKLVFDLSLEEQDKTMNIERFRDNIQFAQRTGLKKFYLWGAEWWYWMKIKHNNSDIWNEANNLF